MSHTPYSFPMLQMLQLLHSPFITNYNPPTLYFSPASFFSPKNLRISQKSTTFARQTRAERKNTC